MDIVHVFDIATNTWFTQRTTAEERYPSGRTSMCSVVASAEDSFSHNIYTGIAVPKGRRLSAKFQNNN